MKTIFYTFMACLLITSCDIESAGNGGIYGNWQLREIDTLATGGTCNMEKSSIYWAFESDVMQVRRIASDNKKLLFKYSYAGDSIVAHTPLLVHTKDELTHIDDKSMLEEFCFTDLKDVFKIKTHKGNNLVIENAKYRMRFRKY